MSESQLTAESLLSAEEENVVVSTIREVEKHTSAELRIHLSDKKTADHFKEAVRTFELLDMHKTAERNAVLIHICVSSRNIAIIGDKGIHEHVQTHFWEEVKDSIIDFFRSARYTDGLVEGIKMVGEELRKFFPSDDENDNELSDEISKDL